MCGWILTGTGAAGTSGGFVKEPTVKIDGMPVNASKAPSAATPTGSVILPSPHA